MLPKTLVLLTPLASVICRFDNFSRVRLIGLVCVRLPHRPGGPTDEPQRRGGETPAQQARRGAGGTPSPLFVGGCVRALVERGRGGDSRPVAGRPQRSARARADLPLRLCTH